LELKKGLTFDDVLLVPKLSQVKSRKDIETKTKLSRRISLNIPIVSANMDTVTESSMAIAIAREGGLGVIHRFLSIQDQVAEVLKVKRSEGFIVEHPHTLPWNNTLGQAKEYMANAGTSSLLITDNLNKLAGMLTSRDILFETDFKKQISELMTPKESLITANPGITIEQAKVILHEHRIEKLPIIDTTWELRGLITTKDIIKISEFPNSCKDEKGRLRVGAAIGVKDGFLERAQELIRAGVDVLVVDIAHGHSDLGLNTIKQIRQKLGDVELIAGNVATADGVLDLISAGVDAIKVGVGPGSTCITRIVAGSGVPQLTAIMDCARAAQGTGIPIIADGGIKNSGDIAKAIAAGASTVMIGGLLAGTDESPGISITKHGRKYKLLRGMASLGASIGRKERENESKNDDVTDFVPEGVEAIVPYRGHAKEVISQLIGGLKSGISYCGAKTILEMQNKAEFIQMTGAGLKESHPHDVEQL